MNLDKHWAIVRSHPILTTPWISLRRDEVALPNGITLNDYYVGELPDVALVMPVTPAGEVVMVRQYRHAAGQMMLELPAGTFDPQRETAAEAAIRELREETGYLASTVEPLTVVYDNPVKFTYKTHLFLAQGVVPNGSPTWDPTEEIEIHRLSLGAVEGAIARQEIAVSGSIVALHLGLQRLR
jgi:ADP-ribose pyrophosphatase